MFSFTKFQKRLNYASPIQCLIEDHKFIQADPEKEKPLKRNLLIIGILPKPYRKKVDEG